MSYLDPHCAVMTDLFCSILQDELTETTYYAEIAGLRYHAVNSSECLSIKVEGYSDKLAVLVKTIVGAIHRLKIDPERFEVLKEQVLRGYRNWSLSSPYEHAMVLYHFLSVYV
jgi:insulysin